MFYCWGICSHDLAIQSVNLLITIRISILHVNGFNQNKAENMAHYWNQLQVSYSALWNIAFP